MSSEARIQTQKCDSRFHSLTSACFHLGHRGLFKERYEQITDFLHRIGGSVGSPWAELWRSGSPRGWHPQLPMCHHGEHRSQDQGLNWGLGNSSSSKDLRGHCPGCGNRTQTPGAPPCAYTPLLSPWQRHRVISALAFTEKSHPSKPNYIAHEAFLLRD